MLPPAAAVGDYIPEPMLLLCGVRAWPLAENAGGSGPVCGDGPRGKSTCCLVCIRCSPEIEARVRSAPIKVKAKEAAERADKAAMNNLHMINITKMTECERRRIWDGGAGGVAMEAVAPTNRAK